MKLLHFIQKKPVATYDINPDFGNPPQKRRLKSIDYFRGIAILFVVAGHSYASWDINTFYEKVVANLITGGTTLFVFISGFLFHHVFYHQFVYKVFFSKKLKTIFIPYLILSTLGFSYFI